MIVNIVIGLFIAACVVALIVGRSPIGYEDGDGFHYGDRKGR